MDNNNNYETQDSSEKLAQQGQNAYNNAQKINNTYKNYNNIKERISNGKKANSLSNAEKNNDLNKAKLEKPGLEKKDGVNSKEGISKNPSGISSKEGLASGASKETSKKGLKGLFGKGGKSGAKAASAASKKAAGAATKVAAGGIKAFLLGNPVVLMVIGGILIFLFFFMIFVFIKVNVIDYVGTNYNISPDDMVDKYADKDIEFGDKESMDKAFNEDETLFGSIGSWISRVFGNDTEYDINKLISEAVKDVSKEVESEVTPGLAIATFITVYNDKEIEIDEEMETNTSFDLLWDLIKPGGKVDVKETMMNNYIKYDYVYYIIEKETNEEGIEEEVCVSKTKKQYEKNDLKFKMFLRYGEETMKKYEAFSNIAVSYNLTDDECKDKLNVESDEVEEAQDYIDEFDDASSDDNLVDNEEYSYKNGFIFKNMDIFNTPGFVYDKIYTPKDIELIINEIFSKEESVNDFLGYNTNASTFSGDINKAWPFFPENVYVNASGNFACRKHPVSNQNDFHAGIDLGVAGGTEVTSPLNGTVIYSDTNSCGCGTVRVKALVPGSSDKYIILNFLHLDPSNNLVDKGAQVTRNASLNDYLGYNGEATLIGIINPANSKTCHDTCSTGPHLHFEAYIESTLKYYNSAEFLQSLLEGDFNYETSVDLKYPAEQYDDLCAGRAGTYPDVD